MRHRLGAGAADAASSSGVFHFAAELHFHLLDIGKGGVDALAEERLAADVDGVDAAEIANGSLDIALGAGVILHLLLELLQALNGVVVGALEGLGIEASAPGATVIPEIASVEIAAVRVVAALLLTALLLTASLLTTLLLTALLLAALLLTALLLAALLLTRLLAALLLAGLLTALLLAALLATALLLSVGLLPAALLLAGLLALLAPIGQLLELPAELLGVGEGALHGLVVLLSLAAGAHGLLDFV